MWYNIGLKDCFFDSDDEVGMQRLSATIRSFVSNPKVSKQKVIATQRIVSSLQKGMILQLKKEF